MKNQILTQEHHRRPRSLGGTEQSMNISYVPALLHICWHTLFGNLNAFQICNVINAHYKPSSVTVICRFINGKAVEKTGGHESKKNSKCAKAWKKLFKGMTFEEIIGFINNTWLDPAYHLYIVS